MSTKRKNKYKSLWRKVSINNIPSSLEIDSKSIIYDISAKILDIGCGDGSYLNKLYQQGYKNLYGVDINANIAKSELNNQIRLDTQDASCLQFDECSFDIAIMKALLTTIVSDHTIMKSFEEAYRVLKKGGKLIIKDFFQNWHLPLYRERYLNHLKNHPDNKCVFPVYSKDGDIRYYARHFNTSELSRMLISIGFAISDLHFENVHTQSGNSVIGFTIIAIK